MAFREARVSKRHLHKLEKDGQLQFDTSEDATPRSVQRSGSRGEGVSPQVAATVALFVERYGGVQSSDSGHKENPRVVFTFPRYDFAQVVLPLNSRHCTAYIRAYAIDGSEISTELPADSIKAQFPGTRIAVSTLNATKTPYLVPSAENPVLLISLDELDRSSLIRIFDRYFALSEATRVEEGELQQTTPNRTLDAFGRLLDNERRHAVELYAMEKAKGYYKAQGFTCHSRGKPFDLLCTKGSSVLHVEVKGTTTSGATVCLTRNEVLDARDDRWGSHLFIWANIRLHKDSLGWQAAGGTGRLLENWSPHDDDLVPTEYAYSVPRS